MGGTNWSDEHYKVRAATLKKKGKTAFEFHDDIKAQKVAEGVHPMMDPAKLNNGLRDSRDSEAHPVSTPVAVFFDVTGSMGSVPRILQKSLPTLFGLCLRKGYVDHPAILVGGIGDATCDTTPLQVGQFESGNEIDDDLSRLYLEGGGGGQQTESYELALYFLARKTATDSFEKRGKKGYAFIIGDEMPYRRVKRREVKEVFGDEIPADIPIKQLIKEAREKWDIYFILPKLTYYYDDPAIMNCWRALLGQSCLKLEDPSGISELIASTIGLAEDAVSLSDLSGNLTKAGVKASVAKAVSAALKGVRPGKPADVPGTGLSTI